MIIVGSSAKKYISLEDGPTFWFGKWDGWRLVSGWGRFEASDGVFFVAKSLVGLERENIERNIFGIRNNIFAD